MFTTLLVALDGGPQHDAVLDLVAQVAGPRSRVHLLCVIDPGFALSADAGDDDRREYPAAARQRSRAEGLLQDAAAQLRERGVDACSLLPAGDPAEVISAQARELDADLLVIGHRHLSRLQRLLDSSVAQWTLDHAPCPVLVETRGG
ncbi:universal stress protein [Stenotrophomonas sp.]|uniref:universal stress protein n=1 Tax=Stenotrophomonas sp. TaxID=69392 RepID=UPI002D2B1002|nr:universal stress protein [Stenotrophomonas sp.]HYQ24943.1 universal stress protein [Stenotrophomonas sp.]